MQHAILKTDQIVQLAREAGGEDCGLFLEFMPELEKFAALVAAAEREACAAVCEALEPNGQDGQYASYLAGWADGSADCAAAIRARRDK